MKLRLSVARPLALLLLVPFAFSPQAVAQGALSTTSFEGVWKIAKVVTAGVTDTNPQPSLAIFSRGYYSILRVTGSAAREASPPANPAQVTDAEKIVRYDEWAPYAASGGTYEVRGNTLITHNIVAKNVGGMTLTEETIIQGFTGDMFVATPKPGEPNSRRQTTYIRVR